MSSSVALALAPAAAVVAVDVGKTTAAVLVTDAARRRLLGPLEFPMTAAGLAEVITKTQAVLPAGLVRVGVEAAGHYHRPLATSAVWPGWQVVQLNPAHVSEQRRVMTDALDLEAITELLLAGRGVPLGEPSTVITELTGWVGLRRRRVLTRVATRNQLLSQLDRCFPGLTLALPNVLGTRVGWLIAEDFADPQRLARLGASRFIRFAAARGLQIRRPVADRLIVAAREALPSPDATVARQILVADLSLLASLQEQVQAAEAAMAKLLPHTPFAPLLTVPGWAAVRASNYAAGVGIRIGGPAQRSCIAPPDCPRSNMSPPAGAATAASAGKAALRCGGRCWILASGCGTPTARRNATADSCGPAANTAG